MLDDIIYISLLCVSVALGPLIRNVPNIDQRKFYSTISGFFIVFIVSGYHILHPLFVIAINAFFIQQFKRKCHILSAIFTFGYLAFFRSCHYFGIPMPPGHTNAIQMILTLKMVGLAFELKGSKESNTTKEVKNAELIRKYKDINPSFLDIFHYSFCIAGVLIGTVLEKKRLRPYLWNGLGCKDKQGPYYKFRTYWDMLHLPYSSKVNANMFLKERIKVVPIYVCFNLLGNYIFPLDFATSPEIMENSFWYRVFYMTPSFFNFRMRIYSGFILGECVCIAMGLGAYPKASNPQPGAGPTDFSVLEEIETKKQTSVEYSFETVKNIYEYGSEFWPTIREGIRSWNRTVQYWLVSFVYKKLTVPKPAKICITMLVSAFWHGVHPGYYLCLCSAPLFLFVEREVEKAFKRSGSPTQQAIFDWIWWVIKMQSFSYMGMPFLLLDISNCLYFWKSVYFCGHIFIVLLYIIAFYVNMTKKKNE